MRNFTDINIILDRSGSMDKIKDDTIGGYNQFITDQKSNPDANLTLIQFDHEYMPVYTNTPITEVPKLTKETFIPRGRTALFDALGKSIKDAGKRLADLPEQDRPNKVLFVIITDGEENDSKEFTSEQILNKIKHQTEVYNWDFVYIGANQDAFANSSNIGIAKGNTLSYVGDSRGTQNVYTKLSDHMTTYRTTDNKSFFE